MAFKHRKLFPTLTVTNQTIDCPEAPGVCDPNCPYSCYTDPDLYFIPPPPPPPPLSAGDQFGQNPHISPLVIIIVSLLASFFLLISYYAIIVKYCSNWSGARNRPPPSQSDGSDEEHLDENQGPVIDHPIWFITTLGLQQAIINSITVCKYKKGEGLIEGTECSVCLSEFQEDETLRLLPKCSHAFHIHCIDTWLRSHTNCPLCRAGILSDTVSPPLNPMDQNSHNLGVNEETQMGNFESEGELGDNQVRNGGVCENRGGTEDEGELQQVNDERMSKEDVNSNGNGIFREDEIQPLRRSVSIGSTMCLGLVAQKSDSDIDPKQEDRNSTILKLVGSSSTTQTLDKSPVSMRRSSSNGGRSFLLGHNRTLSSILPL